MCWTSVSIVDCGFMPLQGELAGDDPVRPLGRPGLFLLLDDPAPVDTAALLAALDAGPVVATPVDVSRREALTGLRTWLALHEPAAGDLLAQREDAHRPMPVLVGPDGLAALAAGRAGDRGAGLRSRRRRPGRPAARPRPGLGRRRPP